MFWFAVGTVLNFALTVALGLALLILPGVYYGKEWLFTVNHLLYLAGLFIIPLLLFNLMLRSALPLLKNSSKGGESYETLYYASRHFLKAVTCYAIIVVAVFFL